MSGILQPHDDAYQCTRRRAVTSLRQVNLTTLSLARLSDFLQRSLNLILWKIWVSGISLLNSFARVSYACYVLQLSLIRSNCISGTREVAADSPRLAPHFDDNLFFVQRHEFTGSWVGLPWRNYE